MTVVKKIAHKLAGILAFAVISIPLVLRTAANGHGSPAQTPSGQVLKGQGALGDWRTDAPGVRRLITPGDMPKPYATPSSINDARIVPRPKDALPRVLTGFKIEQIATGLENPRLIVKAPNGDLFVAESAPGRIHVVRGVDGSGKSPTMEVFATGLRQPFGIAFYPPGETPQFLYVGDTDAVVRFPYQNGDLKARGPATTLATLPGGGRLHGGGHWTRDIAFSNDGLKMFVSVGSHSNVSDDAAEDHRADILEFNPDGSGERIYASGIRNAVGIAIHPTTGELWASVNERDELGDDLVPDYITHVAEGGFYGWPWYYIGPNQDPRHKGKHPKLRDNVLVPDVLLQSHSASLQMTFYTGTQFPAEYRGDAFAAEHGSWNRAKGTGYKIIRVPLRNGKATGEYEDFVTGFVIEDGKVWGRPVGVTVAADGSLVFTDDGSNSVWRVSYVGGKQP
jgi:glucose/arabinose dehydrogenase